MLTERNLSLQDGWTPLVSASLNGHVEVAKVLILSGAHINQQIKVVYGDDI